MRNLLSRSVTGPKALSVAAGLFLTLGVSVAVAQQAATPTATNKDQAAEDEGRLSRAQLELRWAETLSGATLVGHFTDDARPKLEGELLKREKYSLGEVRKLDGDLWLFQARIQYADHDVTLPISLPVAWAGDTPVIMVDNVGFPGLGTYSARVMFHGDRYMGSWQGTNHGGHLFGRIERGQDIEGDAAAAATE